MWQHSVQRLVEYDRLNAKQLALKTIVNTVYGLYNDSRKNTFRPILASLITYGGRLSLVRLVLYSHMYFLRQATAQYKDVLQGVREFMRCRGVVYGDTDSIFIKCPIGDLVIIVDEFQKLPCNLGVVGVELERSVSVGFFLKKKITFWSKTMPRIPYTPAVYLQKD